jgi:hypothetical protein
MKAETEGAGGMQHSGREGGREGRRQKVTEGMQHSEWT